MGNNSTKYRANLSAATLPGQGQSMLHRNLQTIIQSMMKLGGIQSVSGAVNILLDKVREPYITSYIKHVSNHPTARKAPYAIVSDIHSFNLPIGRQRVIDSQNTSAAEAFFKIKTYTACSSRYNHNIDTAPLPDRRATKVVGKYSRKCKKMDSKCQ
jgi:hypothetical protein